uniref:toxin-antitoxin system YwqK family antitoxin n=1 Tax=uncultured Draconibacterium sp. TaxID=1573823 RepID=UPI003217E9E9
MRTNLFFVFIGVIFVCSCSTKSGNDSNSQPEPKDDGIRIVYKPYKNTKDLIEYEIPVVEGTSIKHGIQKRFYRNGSLYSTIPHVAGNREGIAYTYYMAAEGVTPMVWKEQPYKNNKLHGICKRYHEDGMLQAVYEYREGLPGVGLKEYSKSGKEIVQPTLIVSSKRVHNGYYITAKLSKQMGNTDYYIGNLTEGKYLPNGLKGLQTRNGAGEIVVSANTQKVTITAVYSTRYRNSGLVSKTIRLP